MHWHRISKPIWCSCRAGQTRLQDQRFAALEASTKNIMERLELADDLALSLQEESQMHPGSLASTRSTSCSSSCSISDQAGGMLPRSEQSSAPSHTPHKELPFAKSASDGAKRRASCQDAGNNQYATAADVHAICRRSELLLKAMSATVAKGEKRFMRQAKLSRRKDRSL